MAKKNLNSFATSARFDLNGKSYRYHSLPQLKKAGLNKIDRLPYSLKVLLESLLRNEDGEAVKKADIQALANWDPKAKPHYEIQFMPARVILQDFTGVPAVADLAAMRGAIKRLGGDPNRINPLQPADLVIDHSVQVDRFGTHDSLKFNTELEFDRNRERYEFLKWGQKAFRNFRVVPPSTGIVHQVNLEYLARVAMTAENDGETWVYPDTLVGTDSHTTMINGLGVLGWGVGGIEAEAAMLGQPSSMLIPNVIGFRLTGKMPAGTTATDLVLTVTEILRKKGVVGKIVEFFGPGLTKLTLADRATIANMAPEYGATAGLFPVDEVTTDYLTLTGREDVVPLVEHYFKEQGLWYSPDQPEPEFSDLVELDLSTIEPSLAGPSRPQDRTSLRNARASFRRSLAELLKDKEKVVDQQTVTRWISEGGEVTGTPPELAEQHPDGQMGAYGKCTSVKDSEGNAYNLCHGSVVIAAITSCTNTSNPSVLIAAGLLAKKAVEKGLKTRPWVKTSLAPGSKVVTDYLDKSGLTPYLEELKFHLVGYGCTTCIGNSGPLPDHIQKAVTDADLAVASVLSGNRNFEGRVNPHVRANYLASPPLVVAYALAGNMNIDLSAEPLGVGKDGKPVYLKDIWPTQEEIASVVQSNITAEQFKKSYANVFEGSEEWKNIQIPTGDLYKWDPKSTYIKEPPFFSDLQADPEPVRDIKGARVLALLKDSVTTDHISPAGSFNKSSPAGQYLTEQGVNPKDFNSYGSRRGNHEVMMRGTFANVRIKNQLAPGIEGGVTKLLPDGKQMTIFDAAMEYQSKNTPTIILAGKEYGTGSSRDWAAKGPKLQGVRAVIAQSFERIHRSNLIGMGILPLQFAEGQSWQSLGLDGTETFEIEGIADLKVGQTVTVKATPDGGSAREFKVLSRIDTPNEIEYFRHGGILSYVIRQQLKA